MDRPNNHTDYALKNTRTNIGETVASAAFYCDSKMNIWWYICLIWNVVLLLWATVLAIQTRNIRQDFNESKALVFIIYSHFFLVLVHTSTFIFLLQLMNLDLARVRSLIYSADVITTILIYFFPKVFGKEGNAYGGQGRGFTAENTLP